MKVNPIAIYQTFIENLNIYAQGDQKHLDEIQNYTLSTIIYKLFLKIAYIFRI